MKHRKECKIIIILLILALAVIAFWKILCGAILELRYMKAWEIAGMAGLGILYQFMDGFNFTTMAKVEHPEYTTWHGLDCAFYTSFFRVTSFGSAPYAATAYSMYKRGIDPEEGMAISTVNYTYHKIVIAIICIVCGIVSLDTLRGLGDQYVWYFIVSLILVVPIAIFLLGICLSHKFHKFIIWFLHKLDRKHKHDDAIERLEFQLYHMKLISKKQIKNYKGLPIMFIRHVIKQLGIYAIVYLALYDEIQCGFWPMIALTAVVIAIAGVMPAPGGIGTTELAFSLLMVGLASQEKILSAALLFRFFSFYFAGLLGGIMILIQKMIARSRMRRLRGGNADEQTRNEKEQNFNK